jgi:hypothetical protein
MGRRVGGFMRDEERVYRAYFVPDEYYTEGEKIITEITAVLETYDDTELQSIVSQLNTKLTYLLHVYRTDINALQNANNTLYETIHRNNLINDEIARATTRLSELRGMAIKQRYGDYESNQAADDEVADLSRQEVKERWKALRRSLKEEKRVDSSLANAKLALARTTKEADELVADFRDQNAPQASL